MTAKLLTENHLELLSLKGGYTGSSESTLANATLLEITCHGSFICAESNDSDQSLGHVIEENEGSLALRSLSSSCNESFLKLGLQLSLCLGAFSHQN